MISPFRALTDAFLKSWYALHAVCMQKKSEWVPSFANESFNRSLNYLPTYEPIWFTITYNWLWITMINWHFGEIFLVCWRRGSLNFCKLTQISTWVCSRVARLASCARASVSQTTPTFARKIHPGMCFVIAHTILVNRSELSACSTQRSKNVIKLAFEHSDFLFFFTL